MMAPSRHQRSRSSPRPQNGINLKAGLTLLSFALTLPQTTTAHGLMIEPPQRGTLRGSRFAPGMPSDPNAPHDPFAHFPAGSKFGPPGAGHRSQARDGNYNWTPFEPLRRGFVWRAGVCGDAKGQPQDHMRGGKYYYNGKVTRTFRQGGVLESKASIVAHHNGFIELHVCNVARCGGEISEACFRNGHCRQLQRTREQSCESRYDRQCAPIDPAYPGRWYLPCDGPNYFDIYGGSKMRYRLPPDLTCEHCVLHWFWTSANNCNPPGVIEFFRSPRSPNWGTCRGQAGAIGGFTTNALCGGTRFPEEYYQCADIRIESPGRSQMRPPAPPAPVPPAPAPPAPAATSRPTSPPALPGANPIRFIELVADGMVRRTLYGGVTYVDTRPWNQLTFRAVTSRSVAQVDFYINYQKVWTDQHMPYFMMGNVGTTPNYWKTPLINQIFTLDARAEGRIFRVQVRLGR